MISLPAVLAKNVKNFEGLLNTSNGIHDSKDGSDYVEKLTTYSMRPVLHNTWVPFPMSCTIVNNFRISSIHIGSLNVSFK